MSQKTNYKEADRAFWTFRKQIDLSEDYLPINISSEKELFLHAFKEGKVYNPVFQYAEKNDVQFLEKLDDFRKQFDSFKGWPLLPYYQRYFNDLKEHIEYFSDRSKRDFSDWLSRRYAAPTEAEIVHAMETLEIPEAESERSDEKMDAFAARSILESVLEISKIDGWEVVVNEMVARMAVNSVQKRVKIKQDASFSLAEINRLVVHELETHVYRYENGSQQDYLIYAFGFPDYLESEEGLAITNELKAGCLTQIDLKKYSLRFMLADQCLKSSFYEMFSFCLPYKGNDFDEAFNMVLRFKRGLEDTSVAGGTIKDLVYYRGYERVRNLNEETIRALYHGKIGIEHLPVLDEMKDVVPPKYLPKGITITRS